MKWAYVDKGKNESKYYIVHITYCSQVEGTEVKARNDPYTEAEKYLERQY